MGTADRSAGRVAPASPGPIYDVRSSPSRVGGAFSHAGREAGVPRLATEDVPLYDVREQGRIVGGFIGSRHPEKAAATDGPGPGAYGTGDRPPTRHGVRFGSSQRGELYKSQGPDVMYNPSLPADRKGGKFGSSGRGDGGPKPQGPDVLYNPQLPASGRGGKFGSAGRDAGAARPATADAPLYDPRRPDRVPGGVMSGRHPTKAGGSDGPGPGAYGTGDRPRSTSGARFGSSRRDGGPKPQGPDVMYNPQLPGGGKGGKFGSAGRDGGGPKPQGPDVMYNPQLPKSGGVRFGSAQRGGGAKPQGPDVMYNPSLPADRKGGKFSMSGRPSPPNQGGVGPGAYGSPDRPRSERGARFGTATRDAGVRSTDMGGNLYYPQEARTGGFRFGTSTRPTGQKSDVPGPGAYGAADGSYSSPAPKVGTARRFGKTKDIDNVGYLDLGSTLSGPKFTMRPR